VAKSKKMIDSGLKGEAESVLSINLYKMKWCHEDGERVERQDMMTSYNIQIN
jgi:hypothetical protein